MKVDEKKVKVMSNMFIQPEQIRAARAMLDWSQQDLADAAGVSKDTVKNYELANNKPNTQTLTRIIGALQVAGIEFLSDGLRISRQSIKSLEGIEGLKNFMDDVHKVARDIGGSICLFSTNPQNWLDRLGEDWCTFHYKRMLDVKDNFHMRAITNEGNADLIGKGFIDYRWFRDSMPDDKTFYCYGDKLALLDFSEEVMKIWMMEHKGFAQGFKAMFEISWEHAATSPLNTKDDLKVS